jgi:hypothetical protein
MYERDGKCMSQCSACGVACEAPRLTSPTSVERFEKLECEVILGTLDLTSLSDVPEKDLFEMFERVTKIQGDLIIRNAPGIVSLAFFGELRSVNSIVLDNCAALVDAHLPSLETFDSVTVTHCPRLCDARIPGASDSLDQTGCTDTRLVQYFELQGATTEISLTELATEFQLILRGETGDNLTVCRVVSHLCLL